MTTEIFKYILIASLIGTALTVIFSILRPITKKRFAPSWHYSIWLAILVVMILPIRFTLSDVETDIPAVQNEVQWQIQENKATAIQAPAENKVISVSYHYEEPAPTQKFSTAARFITNHMDGLAIIWLLGFLTALLVTISAYIRLLRKIYKNSYLISCPEIRRYSKRRVRVRICRDTSSPFIIGIFCPTLILPDIPLTDGQLDNILMHEATHLNRNDILCKWFTALVKALHWFNPAVYYIAKQINTECEISCDMAVVKGMDNAQTTDYVDTILSLLSVSNAKSLPLTTGMAGNKNTLKKRFAMIKSKILMSKKTVAVSCITAALILGLAICVSGFLSGRWINHHNNNTIELATDKRNGDTFNTLLVGIDDQNRADTIMLLKLTDTSIEGFSIPRNAVFDDRTVSQILTSENGDQKVIDTIRSKLSVPITYYAKIKIALIRDLIDSTGGLTVNVPMNMKYDDPYKNLHIDLKKGEAQTLNGEQICGLLQFRRSNDGTGYPEGDLDRIKIGQQVLSAFLSQNKITELVLNSRDIIDSINTNVVTNYSIKNFIKDKKLLSGKNIAFYVVPGKNSVNNGILNYELDSAQLNTSTTFPSEENTPLEKVENNVNEQSDDAVSVNTTLTTVSEQPQSNVLTSSSYDELQPLEETEIPATIGYHQAERVNFSSIAEAEQYFKADGRVVADEKSFKAGSSYIKDGYSFENGGNETISNIASNNNGEVYMYFNGNINSLMEVSFKDTETLDEVNSAIILTGHRRIYKFTGLDPTRHYDITLTDKNGGEWEIEGKYLIF